MKKYLKLLYIALFAMMSVSLTACGDDDDEPDGGSSKGKYSCNLTIDGNKFKSKIIAGEIWKHNGLDALTIWVNDATYFNEGYIIFETDSENVSEGANISEKCTFSMDVNDVFIMAGVVKKGKVTVTKYDKANSIITVKFDNVTFEEANPFKDETVVVNGTMTSPLNGADKPAKL